MQYKEYGKQNRDVIILLHGGGLSWWNYREVSERLQNDFRIIIPILDGHAGSDENFTTIEDNAAEIISFIDKNFGGSVLLIGGLYLSAVKYYLKCYLGEKTFAVLQWSRAQRPFHPN